MFERKAGRDIFEMHVPLCIRHSKSLCGMKSHMIALNQSKDQYLSPHWLTRKQFLTLSCFFGTGPRHR